MPLDCEKPPKIRKKRGKIKNQEKEGRNQEKIKKKEKLGRNGKNWDGSFTLPLLTDRAGYATGGTLLGVLHP